MRVWECVSVRVCECSKLYYVWFIYFFLFVEKGLEESFGIMANYNYILEHIEDNNKQYLCDGTITISNIDPVLVDESKRASSNIKIIQDK